VQFKFTGICALTPAVPRDSQPSVDRLSAILPYSPRARRASVGSQIDAMFTFIIVPKTNVLENGRTRSADFEHNDFKVFFLNRERLVIVDDKATGVTYRTENGRGDVPTTSSFDSRWICDFRDILPSVGIRSAVLADGSVDPALGARIDFRSGTVSSGFPCEPGARPSFSIRTRE
jgi:hypothetical protein